MLLRPKCENIHLLKLTAEQRPNDLIMQQWQSELRMVTVEFKQQLKLEEYVLYEIQKYHQAICN